MGAIECSGGGYAAIPASSFLIRFAENVSGFTFAVTVQPNQRPKEAPATADGRLVFISIIMNLQFGSILFRIGVHHLITELQRLCCV